MTSADESFLARCRYYCGLRRNTGHEESASAADTDWPSLLRRRAASEPDRMIACFREIIACPRIPDHLAAPIFEGIVDHRLKQIGPSPDSDPSDARPASFREDLDRFILDALDEHPFLRERGDSAADAILACGSRPPEPRHIPMLMSQLLRLAGHPDPEPVDISAAELETVSRRSVRGKSAQAAMRFAVALQRNRCDRPNLLASVLYRFATDPHPGVRISVLDPLIGLGRDDPETAWRLFDAAMRPRPEMLWPYGEPFLRARYGAEPRRVTRWLARNRGSIPHPDSESWGACMGAALLAERISVTKLLSDLHLTTSETARDGALRTLLQHLAVHPERGPALHGLLALMEGMVYSPKRVGLLEAFFESTGADSSIDITTRIAYKLISDFDATDPAPNLDWFHRWVAALYATAPTAAIRICESLLSRIAHSNRLFRIWQGDRLIRLCEPKPGSRAEGIDPVLIDRILELGIRGV